MEIDLFTSSEDSMGKSDPVIKDISKQVEIGEGSNTVIVPETDNDDICSVNEKENLKPNVRNYSKSKTENKYLPIRNKGCYFE